jgi:hypothetical protein
METLCFICDVGSVIYNRWAGFFKGLETATQNNKEYIWEIIYLYVYMCMNIIEYFSAVLK